LKLLVRFNTERVREAITSDVILETGISINILSASLNEKGGEMLLEVPDERADEIRNAFERRGVEVEARKYVEILENMCVHCGACYSICPTDAIQLDTYTFRISLVKDSCIGCLRCIDVCPVEAIVKVK